jgi:hypothetical protein
MEYSTRCRIAGGVNTLAGSFFTSTPIITDEKSFIPLAVVGAYLAIDGISDIVTGRHHYLTSIIEHCFKKPEKAKDEIDGYLKN